MTPAPASPSRPVRRECVLLLLLAVVPALLAGWLHPKRPAWNWSKPGVTEATLSEVTRWPPPVLWVDARSLASYQIQHVPGALLLNEDDWDHLLPGLIEVWRPNLKVIVYCDSEMCDASQSVALRLQRELGRADIHVLKGGWAAWLKQHP